MLSYASGYTSYTSAALLENDSFFTPCVWIYVCAPIHQLHCQKNRVSLSMVFYMYIRISIRYTVRKSDSNYHGMNCPLQCFSYTSGDTVRNKELLCTLVQSNCVAQRENMYNSAVMYVLWVYIDILNSGWVRGTILNSAVMYV